jgi:hypothetical protein
MKMIVKFEDIVKKLFEQYKPGGELKLKIDNQYLFHPVINCSYPACVTSKSLMDLKGNGSDVEIGLESGLVKINYGENKREVVYFRFPGTFDGTSIDGEKIRGVFVGDNVGPKIDKEVPDRESALRAKNNLKALSDMGLLKDFGYVESLEQQK